MLLGLVHPLFRPFQHLVLPPYFLALPQGKLVQVLYAITNLV